MEKINYPLLYFTLADDLLLGKLVGTEIETVAPDLESLKHKIQQHLKKEYRRNRDYPDVRLKKARLKILNVAYRPAFREMDSIFPLPYSLQLPVPAIYGETIYGYYECYLPLFDTEFPYYEARHLEPLAVHQANSTLNNLPLQEIFQLKRYGAPKLDFVLLRVKEDHDFEWSGFQVKKDFPTLTKLADRFPFPKAVQRAISPGPDAAWEREEAVEQVVDKVLGARSNLIVVGEPGSGKSTVLQQAIRKMVQQSRSWSMEMAFWRILPQRITASSKYLGEWEETCEEIVNELEGSNGVLWVLSLMRLLEIGGTSPQDSVAAFFLNYLQQGKMQMIGEATPQEIESMRRLLPNFMESFQLVYLEKLPEDKIRSILNQYAAYVAQNKRIEIEEKALDNTYRLLQRYYPYETFPGKAIKFLSQCLAGAELNGHQKIDSGMIIDRFVEQTGLPRLFLNDQEFLEEKELEQFFEQKIIGQPKAIQTMTNLVKVFKAGLNAPDRPIATLIFAGPTGVGKTASAQTLADYFFGKGQKKSPLIRIDMSEFQHPGQINRLIGVGQNSGQLIKEIRERPFSVLLLDEIEKADSSIFDALLTVLDEGMLVDAYGRVTNFRNTIIIMTSNLGAVQMAMPSFIDSTDPEANYRSAIEKHFRPEFVNRIDGVVIFNPLGPDDIRNITLKELEDLKKREGFAKRNLQVKFTGRVTDHLSRIGFDERYGARPLQRAIEQSIVNPIANWILLNGNPKNCQLLIDFDQQIRIKKL